MSQCDLAIFNEGRKPKAISELKLSIWRATIAVTFQETNMKSVFDPCTIAFNEIQAAPVHAALNELVKTRAFSLSLFLQNSSFELLDTQKPSTICASKWFPRYSTRN